MPERFSPAATPVFLWGEKNADNIRQHLSSSAQNYLEACGYKGKSGAVLLLPNAHGASEAVLLGVGEDEDLRDSPFLLAKLSQDLAAGSYILLSPLADPDLAYLGFRLGQYRFNRFKKGEEKAVTLAPPIGCNVEKVERYVAAITQGRNLINTPANHLSPPILAAAAHQLAARFGAKSQEISGDALLEANFPLIHAVGRAAAHSPRLVEFTWGEVEAPHITLVGKGVTFDTGGLNIKPDNSMLLMRKDMGGAATALTCAQILMAEGAAIHLRVLLPIVENSIAGNAFRPGDIEQARNGLTVEIGNTDAEGRLILADALSLADEAPPEWLIDFATLTGAARVALGPDLPAFFTDDDEAAALLTSMGKAQADPVWRLPLWSPYLSMMDSKYADINNAGTGGLAGAITAALFLKRFVKNTKNYIHFDLFGWNPSAKPGRPEGGEPQTARLVAEFILKKYGSKKP